MPTVHKTVFNRDGVERITETEQFNAQQKQLAQQNWMDMQRLQEVKDSRLDRANARTQRIGQQRQQAQGNGFVMVDGVPVSTQLTKRSVTGQRVNDPSATTDRALEIAMALRGSAADRSGYAMDLQGVKNDPRLQETARLGEMDQFNREQKLQDREDGAMQRQLREMMLQGQMDKFTGGNQDIRDAMIYGDIENMRAEDRAAKRGAADFNRDLQMKAIGNPNIDSETRRQLYIKSDATEENAAIAARLDPVRSANEYSLRFDDATGKVIGPRLIKSLKEIGNAATSGVLPYWGDDDVNKVADSVKSMLRSIDTESLLPRDKNRMSVSLINAIEQQLDLSSSSFGNERVSEMISNLVNQVIY
ncbi:hypothetical protein KAU11_08230 [Candidatus Babeliales bacterium]|nr:hypothetical protein [Candidatus Babeliales bacterium]